MRSVRARITITAAIVTAIALAIAAVVLLQGLRSSLMEQLDDSISDQVVDLQVNIFDDETLYNASGLNDSDTLQVILDEVTNEPYVANDFGVTAAEIQAEVPLAESLDLDDPLLMTGSIDTATDTPGADDIRLAFAPLFLIDETPEDPVVYAVVGRVLGPIGATVAATRTRLLLVLPAVVAIVAALAWWLTGRALRPVDRMRQEVDDITAGDLRRRVSEPVSQDEIAELAVTMNSMLGRLQTSGERQQQFVSDAAHELRTPLTSIAAQLDVDAAHPVTADHLATASAVRSEVARMQSLIENLLGLARSDQASKPLPMKLLDLDETARASAARVTAPDHVSLVTDLAPLEVRGDDASLQRIVDNLLTNAYRHAASKVLIASGRDGEGLWLAVDDDGAGVPVDARDAIFGRFVRLDAARTRDAGGSGLGLAMSRELARAHGGTLTVGESQLGGARFLLRLPAT